MHTKIRTPMLPNFLFVEVGVRDEGQMVSIADLEPEELAAVADDWKKKLLERREYLRKVRREEATRSRP